MYCLMSRGEFSQLKRYVVHADSSYQARFLLTTCMKCSAATD
jgi:hypothetical protein